MRIIEVNPEVVDPVETKIQDVPLEAKISMAEVNEIRTHTKANIKMAAIKAIITRVTKDFIIIHIEIFLKVIATNNLEVEAMAKAEAIIAAMVMVGLIIEAMLIINIISIMVMMMSSRQTNMVHHVLYVGGYNHSLKHCFKGEHDINDIMEKMNINGHQSQSSGLYS